MNEAEQRRKAAIREGCRCAWIGEGEGVWGEGGYLFESLNNEIDWCKMQYVSLFLIRI